MASFTNLLAQTTQSSLSDAPTSLTDTLRKHAKQLTDADITVLVAGLREQRQLWNAAQAAGSRERVTSKKVKLKPPPMQLESGGGFTIKKPTI